MKDAQCAVSICRRRRAAWRGSVVLIFVMFAAGGIGAAVEAISAEQQALADRAAAEFKRADTDGDGQLTPEEFLAKRSGGDRQDEQRRFIVFDFDGDSRLNREEFRQLLAPLDERGMIPDPILKAEQAALARWKAAFTAADTDASGGLTRDEWPAGQIAAELPALAGVGFGDWDRDHNASVDEDEGRWLLEVAYGLTQLDGRALRTPAGRVFAWSSFRRLDKSGDGLVSREEFVAGHDQGPEKNAELFVQLDADRDGRLTAEETLHILWHDNISWFYTFDRDKDGYVTTDEFVAVGWATPLGRRLARAFDDDGDRKISITEFRGTPFANLTSNWESPRRDADNDGRLSWKEFYLEKPPQLVAQGRWFFDHFDLDKDGFLSYAELEFDVSLDKVPPEVLFAARDTDGDGKVTFAEAFGEAKPADASALQGYEMRLASAESRFLSDDKDSSGYLDLPEFVDSQRAAIEAARKRSKVIADRASMLEGNYWVRQGVLVVNEIAFLGIVWLVLRKTKKADIAQ